MIFGDDGFRDRVGTGFLRIDFLNNFFESLNIFLKKEKIKKIVLGFDTRKSSKNIIDIILSNIKSVDKIIIHKKPIVTPDLHFCTKSKKTLGIMITASHFTKNYNGFKFFLNGKKLTKKKEKIIEKNLSVKNKITKKKKYKIKFINDEKYINYLNKKFNFTVNKKILVDCANGSASNYINKVKFLSRLEKINYNYNGNNINFNSGSNCLNKNLKRKLFKSKKYCIAFDGDGDRVLFSKKDYGIIESEKIILIFLNYLLKNNKKNSIIGTEITNPWLKEYLRKKKKIKFIKSKVGDRNVIDKKNKFNSFIGFETSGHYCIENTMDGMYAAGLFLKILKFNENIINDVLKLKIIYKEKVLNYPLASIKKIKRKLNIIKKNRNFHLIIRKSIWNPYLKLYLFYKKKYFLNLSFHEKKLLNEIFKIKFKERKRI